MLCRNVVKDFARWKKIFDSQENAARNNGLKLMEMWQEVNDPDNVFFIWEVENIDKANEFINDPESAKIGEKAGVIDGWCYFIDQAR